MDSGEREMNPVTMNIINPQKRNIGQGWNQWTSVVKPSTLLNEPLGLDKDRISPLSQ